MDILAIFAVLLQLVTIYFPILCISRFLMGIYCAITTGLIPSWIISMSPSFRSGIFGTFNQLAVVFGMAEAYLMG
jgi:SP family facilitated glucose transporter-like MFS transporter 1